MRWLSLPHTSEWLHFILLTNTKKETGCSLKLVPLVFIIGVAARTIPPQLINGSFPDGTERALWELHDCPSPQVQCRQCKDRHRQVLFCPYTQARCQNKHQLWIFLHYQDLRPRDTFLQQKKKMLLLLILHVSSAKKHKITQCKAWR